MNVSDLKLGQRVVTNAAVDVYPLGVWLAGTQGTVMAFETMPDGQVTVDVKLDVHSPALNEWDNCLIVWSDIDEANSDLRLCNFDVL